MWYIFQDLYFLLLWGSQYVLVEYHFQSLHHWCANCQSQVHRYQHGIRMEGDIILKRRKWVIALKLVYLYLNIYWCRIVNNGLSLLTVGIILLMGASGTFMLSDLFVLSHNFELWALNCMSICSTHTLFGLIKLWSYVCNFDQMLKHWDKGKKCTRSLIEVNFLLCQQICIKLELEWTHLLSLWVAF
jgi:hypothetical protein